MRLSKKIILGVVLGAFLLSMAPIGAPVAQAQFGNQGLGDGGGLPPTSDAAQQANLQKYGGTAAKEISCSAGIEQCLAQIMYYIGPGLAGYVAYIGAYFFSIVIQLSLNSTAYALQFLTDGWTTVRDLANMAFIFILIYIALMVMLQADTSGTIKTLAVVIVIALLVNFSFFFTRVAIDAGNILALQFYNAILPVPGVAPIGNGVKDLSGSLMGAVGPQVLLSSAMFDKAKIATGNSAWAVLGVYTVIYLSVAAMLWMLFFTFIQVGIKFMLRIVGLWFILISSPLAFVARTMPKTKPYFDEWFKRLIQYSLYPAVFLFMFLILTRFAGSLMSGGTAGGGSLLNAVSHSFDAVDPSALGTATTPMGVIASVAIRMGFIIALMYVALHVSEWVVKEGSALASKVTGNLTGRAFGAAGFAGRNTFGWAGQRLAESKRLQDWGARNALVRGTLLRGARSVGSASFDARGSKTIGGALGLVGGAVDAKTGKVTPLDMGKAQKGGLKAQEDARIKWRQKEAEKFTAPTEAEKEAAKEKGEGLAAAEFEKSHGAEKSAVISNLEKARKDHESRADEIKKLEARRSAATSDMERKVVDDMINSHPTLKILKEAEKKKVEFDEKEKGQMDILKAKHAPDFDYRKKYAANISKAGWSNLIRLGAWVPKADQRAADKVRKGKSDNERLLEAIKEGKESGDEKEKKEEKH